MKASHTKLTKAFAVLAATMISVSAFAARDTKPIAPKCQKVAEAAAVKANYKKFGAETSLCGSKLLHLGELLETYLVCVSDETDPSEWIVAVERDVVDIPTATIKGSCKVDYTGYAIEAATPDFDK